MRTVTATRYVTPLREGGSLPAIVEADDFGTLRGQVPRRGPGREGAGGRAGDAASWRAPPGCASPSSCACEVDAALGRNEPDQEIRDLLRASVGLNLGLDYLPGSITFDPVAGPAPPAAEASDIVWFDAFISNVDRTARNPNLLCWHGRLWLIDHGAALYFHHAWDDELARSQSPFAAVKDHVLLPWATRCAGGRATADGATVARGVRARARGGPGRMARRRAALRVARRRTAPPTSAISSAGSRPRPLSWRRPNVPALLSFDYALLRVVPRVEREEFVNAGVVLFCMERDFLEARVELDRARVLALLPDGRSGADRGTPARGAAHRRRRQGRRADRAAVPA